MRQKITGESVKAFNYKSVKDARGVFIKPWLLEDIEKEFDTLHEVYIHFSHKGVFRGLHYQSGNSAQKKYVACLSGEIEDISVDLRNGSSDYGKVFRYNLKALNGIGLIIPPGFAHGIFAHQDSTVISFCDKPYSPETESGISYKSISGIEDLVVTNISEKDSNLPPFNG